MENNNLPDLKRSIRSSFIHKNKKNYIKFYSKLKKIDTVIFDTGSLFLGETPKIMEYITKHNIENIIIDSNKKTKEMAFYINQKTNIKNISFLNYPQLDGITIPFDVLKNEFQLKFAVDLENLNNIKNVNILYENDIKQINLDDNVHTITFTYLNEILEINIFSSLLSNNEFKNVKCLNIDESGNIKTNECIKIIDEDIKNGVLDLREYQNIDKLYLDINDKIINKLVINVETLKNKITKYYGFTNVPVRCIEVIDDNDMKLNPTKLEFKDEEIKFSIVKHFEKPDVLLLKSINENLMKNTIITLDINNNIKVINTYTDLLENFDNDLIINTFNKIGKDRIKIYKKE